MKVLNQAPFPRKGGCFETRQTANESIVDWIRELWEAQACRMQEHHLSHLCRVIEDALWSTEVVHRSSWFDQCCIGLDQTCSKRQKLALGFNAIGKPQEECECLQ